MKPIYQEIANRLIAIKNCEKTGNLEWRNKHDDAIDSLMSFGPSGGGYDNGTELDYEKSNNARLVFHTSFHHMDENGCYNGWTDHTIRVKPCLAFGFIITASGKNVNDILTKLVSENNLKCNWVLSGFPHPSGANGHRAKQFEMNKTSMMNKLNTWKV